MSRRIDSSRRRSLRAATGTLLLCAALGGGQAPGWGQTPQEGQTPAGHVARMDAALTATAAEYRRRTQEAAEALTRTRARVAAEKAPVLERIRAAEERLVAAERELTRLEATAEAGAEERRQRVQDLEALRKTTGYAATVAREGLGAVVAGLSPGEEHGPDARVAATLQTALDQPAPGAHGAAALEVVEFLLGRTERLLGGYRTAGTATVEPETEVRTGTFVYVGPETFFQPEGGGTPGTVRRREGARHPVSHPLPGWGRADADSLFAGRPGAMLADASGGRALRLQETMGTPWEHIRKGGVMAFAILAVGALSLVLILGKLRDVRRLRGDRPEQINAVLALVARGAFREAEVAVRELRPGTRALFAVGLRHACDTKVILEERLEAELLRGRLDYERHLPLLAVIATAAPLMGLLGTVVGMVKTFALITVFGTGNAGKLSSGISEVLVATELGLAVAIPTLVAHGFLSHRIQKQLGGLERSALEFCTAVELSRSAAPADVRT